MSVYRRQIGPDFNRMWDMLSPLRVYQLQYSADQDSRGLIYKVMSTGRDGEIDIEFSDSRVELSGTMRVSRKRIEHTRLSQGVGSEDDIGTINKYSLYILNEMVVDQLRRAIEKKEGTAYWLKKARALVRDDF